MTATLKTHLALNTEKFDESVTFYRSFFGIEPVKLKEGYAKFDVENPPLNLTLNRKPLPDASAINHLGIQVGSTEEVKAAVQRLSEAGLATWEEENTDCCYALQDKVWVRDPNGHGWEVFVVKVADTAPEASVSTQGEACCAPGCCG